MTRHALRVRTIGIVTVLVLPALTASPTLGEAEIIAFTDVDVIPMDAERILPDQVVLVHDDRIAAVGPVNLIPVPEDARIVEADGLYLMPGLADMHVHNWFPAEHKVYLANGITTVRNMWGTELQLGWRAGEGLPPDHPFPTYITPGPIVDGAPPVWPNSVGVDGPDEAAEAVREQFEAHYDFIKVYSKLSLEEFDAIASTANRLGIPFGGHVPMAVPLEHAYASGFWCNEHLTGYGDACQAPDSPLRAMSPEEITGLPMIERALIRYRFIDESTIEAVARMTREHNTWNCPTLIVNKRMRMVWTHRDELLKREEMKYVAPIFREMWNPENDFRIKDATAEEAAEFAASFPFYLKVTKALHEAGGDLLLGTDTPNPFVFPGFSLHEELELLVEAGLSPYEALRTGTANPARFLEQTEEFGRIAPGLRADLLLLRANPLEVVGNTREIEGVMLRGRWFDRAALGAMLEEVAHEFATQAESSE